MVPFPMTSNDRYCTFQDHDTIQIPALLGACEVLLPTKSDIARLLGHAVDRTVYNFFRYARCCQYLDIFD